MSSGAPIIKYLEDAIGQIQSAKQVFDGNLPPKASVSARLRDYRVPLPAAPFTVKGLAYQVDTSQGYDWKSVAHENGPLVYNDDYFDRLVGSQIKGADHPDLNGLMHQLLRADLNDPNAYTDIVNQIADIRGVDRGDFMEQMDRYKQLLHEKVDGDGSQHYAPSDHMKADFMGSLSHLRFGQVIGDVLGIDPIFGAMMNPTGGIVGPDAWGQVTGSEEALTYHGIVHDAGGFLHNYFGVGPGYDYLDWDSRGTSPLSGQLEGVRYWQEKFGMSTADMVGDIVEWGGHFVGDVVKDYGYQASDYLDRQADNIGGIVNRGFDKVGNYVGGIPGSIIDKAGDLAESNIERIAEDFTDDLRSGLDIVEWTTDQIGKNLDRVIEDAFDGGGFWGGVNPLNGDVWVDSWDALQDAGNVGKDVWGRLF